jgi:hypothetical protein
MRNYYHLPTKLGSFAVQKYIKAKSLALELKKTLLEQEGAVAILRQEDKGLGLIYTGKEVRSGFTLPTKYEGYWLLKPKKNTIIGKRVQADAVAILRQEDKGLGLIYTGKEVRSGFTLPTKYEGYWLLKPKKNTIIGKRVQAEMDNVCHYINKWQWALEDALNLKESVYKHQQWDLTVCHPMPDESVLISQPVGAKKMLSQEYQISQTEFDRLKGLSND